MFNPMLAKEKIENIYNIVAKKAFPDSLLENEKHYFLSYLNDPHTGSSKLFASKCFYMPDNNLIILLTYNIEAIMNILFFPVKKISSGMFLLFEDVNLTNVIIRLLNSKLDLPSYLKGKYKDWDDFILKGKEDEILEEINRLSFRSKNEIEKSIMDLLDLKEVQIELVASILDKGITVKKDLKEIFSFIGKNYRNLSFYSKEE